MARMTNAQLVDENIRLREHCALLEARIARLETERQEFKNYAPVGEIPTRARQSGADGRAEMPAASKPDPRDYSDYYAYVNDVRAWTRSIGQKVAGYVSAAQFRDLAGAR